MAESRRCSRPGCRAWSMRGHQFCRAHEPLRPSAGDVQPAADAIREVRAAELGQQFRDVFVQRVTEALVTSGAQGEPGGVLSEEIGALRLVMVRLLDQEEDPAQLAISVPRIVDATVRALRAQQTMSGVSAEHLTEALTQMLLELGIGAE